MPLPLLGAPANPARPVRQVIGVISEKTAQVVAGALQRLGCERAQGYFFSRPVPLEQLSL